MAAAEDQNKKPAPPTSEPKGPPHTPQRADTDDYDPVGMAGKPAGIVEELREDVESTDEGAKRREEER
jgi:hypothetical protein